MFTVIRNQEAPITTDRFQFVPRDAYPGSSAPRFDKIRTQMIYKNKGRDYVKKSASTINPDSYKRNLNVKYEGPPLIDTKAFK